MNDQYVKNVIEAALLAAGRPLTMDELVSVFDERDGSNAEEVRSAIAALTVEVAMTSDSGMPMHKNFDRVVTWSKAGPSMQS